MSARRKQRFDLDNFIVVGIGFLRISHRVLVAIIGRRCNDVVLRKKGYDCIIIPNSLPPFPTTQ